MQRRRAEVGPGPLNMYEVYFDIRRTGGKISGECVLLLSCPALKYILGLDPIPQIKRSRSRYEEPMTEREFQQFAYRIKVV